MIAVPHGSRPVGSVSLGLNLSQAGERSPVQENEDTKVRDLGLPVVLGLSLFLVPIPAKAQQAEKICDTSFQCVLIRPAATSRLRGT
jgi:hypothetical protein